MSGNATDPVQALLGLANEKPDPRAVSAWITAYLGKRPTDAKRAALHTLERAFMARPGGERATGLILRVIQKLSASL